jgi:hypothetical protein
MVIIGAMLFVAYANGANDNFKGLIYMLLSRWATI